MKFNVKFNGREFIVDAESAVHAVIMIIDIGFNITENMEFQVGLINKGMLNG